MGNITKLINGLMVTGAVLIGSYLYFFGDPGLPDSLREDHYWGRTVVKGGNVPQDSLDIKRFAINVPEEVLSNLKQRLDNVRLTESLEGTNFEYGIRSDVLIKILTHWSTKYNWRAHESAINKLDHFKTQIEGLDVHFIRAKASGPGIRTVHPLMLVHGWPGSFVEYLKLIPLLTKPDKNGVAFELVIPSIPGFGFSEASSKPGFNVIHVARIFSKLMTRLGHDQFFYHGSDWGSVIGKALGALFPQRLNGLHITMPIIKFTPYAILKIAIGWILPSFVFDNPTLDAAKLYPLIDKLTFLVKETGYFHIQATKPDTIGVALNDSPAGLAAYILEKFSGWTNSKYVDRADGGLTEKFTIDELLTNVMVYYITNSITTSQRLYKEQFSMEMQSVLNFDRVAVPLTVPVGIASFPNEIPLLNLPRTVLVECYHNITQYSNMPRGGHFPAMEEPELLAQDIRDFLHSIQNYHRLQKKITVAQ